MRVLLWMFVMVFLCPHVLRAQTGEDPLAAARLSLEEEQWERAEELLKDAAEADSTRAAAYYELARLYFEGSLKDVGRSKSLAQKAIELEPNNVDYLTLRLRQRQEYPSIWFPSFQAMKRQALVRKIAALDSTNPAALLEIGTRRLSTYLALRDGITVFRHPGNPQLHVPRIESKDKMTEILRAQRPKSYRDLVDRRFRFDIERLKSLGVPVIDRSQRAEEAYPEAERHLTGALQRDPMLRAAHFALLQLYVASGDYQKLLEAAGTMRRYFSDDPLPYLASGLAHYHLADIVAAERAFDAASAVMSSRERAAFENISFLLSDTQKAQFNQSPIAYNNRFWSGGDIRLLTSDNERRVEHYARKARASLLFGESEAALFGWDERGEVYVRYGAPERHYKLVARGTLMGSSGCSIWQYSDFRLVFCDASPGPLHDYILYSPKANAFSNPWAIDNDYVIKAREQFRTDPERSTYASESRARIPFLVSRFKSESGSGTTFYVPFGIRTPYKPAGERYFDWGVRTGVFLVDPGYGVISQERGRVPELHAERISEFEEATIWTGVHTVSAAPGEYALSVEFATEGEKTMGFERIDVTAPDFSNQELMLSDLLLAYHIEQAFGDEVEPGRIRRGGLSIAPVPWGVFAIDQPIYLYFEVYNLDLRGGQASYQVQAALAPHDEDGTVENVFESIFGGDEEGGVAVQFEAKSASIIDDQYLIMNASDQPPGEYVLLLRVQDQISGQTATAERVIVLE